VDARPLHLHLRELLAHAVGTRHVGIVPVIERHALGRCKRDQQFACHEGSLLFLLIIELSLMVLAEDRTTADSSDSPVS
jgi:hypothetical protein